MAAITRAQLRPVPQDVAHGDRRRLAEPADRGLRHRLEPLLDLLRGVIAALPCSSSSTTWCSARLPIRHGVHFWHDSSAKKRIVSASRRSTG